MFRHDTTGLNIRITRPSIDLLSEFSSESSKLRIVTPYYTNGGLLALKERLSKSVESIQFYTKLDAYEWIKGASDPVALQSFRKDLVEKGVKTELFTHSTLHAKVYIGGRIGIFGSANLTLRAFQDGVEVVAVVSGDELRALERFTGKLVSDFDSVKEDEFETFISRNRPVVAEYKRKLERALAKARLHPAKPRAAPRKRGKLLAVTLGKFLDFCGSLGSQAADEVIARAYGKHNLVGHIKHFYYGSELFLDRYPVLITRLAKEDPATFRLGDSKFLDLWRSFLRSRQLKDHLEWSFYRQTLINYLPVSLGGPQVSGGAGSGNLNRVLPLVAKYRLSEGR